MTTEPHERGTALLTVLLLVAVMATIASTLLDRIGLATQLTANARTAGQARAWLATAEALGMARIEDLLATRGERLTDAGGWLAVPRTIALPDGGEARATVRDGGNCFNLNALVRRVDGKVLAARREGQGEFVALLGAVGVDAASARRIAAAATDYLDDDDLPQPGGVERGGYPSGALPANRMMADASELRGVPGVTPEQWRRISPWLCALPVVGGSPVNVNTLRLEDSPLVVMLSRGSIDLSRARALIARRPPSGFASAAALIGSASADEPGPAGDAAPGVSTRYFRLLVEVTGVRGDSGEHGMTSLIDATARSSRVIARRWGIEG